MGKSQINLKRKKANQFSWYDLEHISTFVKQNIRNYFEFLNLIDRESGELWKEITEVVKNKCEKRHSEIKKQKNFRKE